MTNHYTKWFNRTERQVSKKGNFVKLLFFFATILISSATFAQERIISGKITDAADGTGIPGTSIAIKGTTKGATTDANGAFKINAADGAVLIVSSVGYLTQEIASGNRSLVDVALKADTKSLDEVVVVGYGTQKRNEISGTVSSVSSKEFNVGQVTTPLQAIAGKIAGLAISQTGSDPNGGQSVRLRGVGSLEANSTPLYVVDGVFVDDISTISPQDIENVDVLRDASSAAIYGSRGADGVIIITTKRGKDGKVTASYSGYVGSESISAQPDYANADEFRAASKISKAADKGANTDWIAEMTRGTAITQNHDVSFTGGGKGFGYRASIGYLNQQGIVKKSERERTTASFNIDQTALNGKLKVAYNLFYAKTDRNILDRDGHLSGSGTGASFGLSPYFALGMVGNMFPTDPVKNADGSWYEDVDAFSKFNPVAILMESTDNKVTNEYRGAINAKYSIFDGLTAGLNLSSAGGQNVSSYFISRKTKATSGIGGAGGRFNEGRVSNLLEATLNYDKKIGTNSNLGLLAGYGYQDIDKDGFFAQNAGFTSDDLGFNFLQGGNTIPSGQEVVINGSQGGFINSGTGSYRNNERLISFFGRAQYSMNNTYFFTANLRQDGSTKFGANNKWGLFPSLSAAVDLSQLFFKGNPVLDQLKFRVNWGKTGQSNSIRPYQTLPLVGPQGFYYNNGNFLPQYVPTQDENPDLKWQVNTTSGAGIDFSILKYRLTGSLDYYQKSTTDLLARVPTIPWTDSKGVIRTPFAGNILTNIGELSNKGLELTLNGLIVNKKNFTWNMTVAAASNQNKVVSLESANFKFGNPTFIPTSLGDYVKGTSRVNFTVLQEGQAVGTFWGAQVLSVNDKGGFVIKDQNGDGKLDADGDDRTSLGSAQPKLLLSLTNGFTAGNWSANFLLNGRFGNKILNGVRLLYANGAYPSGLDGNFLAEAGTTNVKNTQIGSYDYYIEDGGFMRLQNASVAYRFPNAVGALKNLSMYVSGNNLFVLTGYKGVDPELNLNGLNPGVDTRNNYWKTRGFQFGVNASF